MTEQKKNQLAALLIERSMELMEEEYIYTNDRDFEKLREIYEKRGIITDALEKLF